MFAQLEEQLEFEFQFSCPHIESEYYREGAQDLIRRLIPGDLLEEDRGLLLASQRARFADMLPLIQSSELSRSPCALSVLLLTKYRLNACNFFYDMISRWLLPQKRVNVELFFASDVRLPHLTDDLLSVAEIVVYLKSAADVEAVRRNLHAIETEIRLGVVSNYHARRILEFKGLSNDGKTAMIQEKIGSLIQSHSKDYDRGIFSQMQHFLVSVQEGFKTSRDYHHISRIISNLHSLRKFVEQNARVYPNKRHVIFKFLKTKITPKGGSEKAVLGILAGINFLKEHEVFETAHLISAIQKGFPQVKLVEGSQFVDKGEQAVQTLYMEVAKPDGTDFSLDEVQKLKVTLPDQIKGHIEQLTHPIFMPRNEEEVLRNIMALSRQIRYVGDLPHLIISFDEQKGTDLYFSVILLRVISQNEVGLEELFRAKQSSIKYIPDRVRRVGQLRKRYAKEATVFRTYLPSIEYLREDRSIDLYRARKAILDEVSRILGKVRDYNGGMIFKLTESLNALKESFGHSVDPILLEKFFYSIVPIEMRSSLETEPLKQCFLTLMHAIRTDSIQHKMDAKRVYIAMPRQKKLPELSYKPQELVTFSLEIHDAPYVGAMYFSSDRDKQLEFLHLFQRVSTK
ncbi:MAG: hypothetical protein A3D96_06295 [Chlamydiae bacterium RIFCSPHIGHO2_12_FULL_44_59]|nr:MAG: hypothetical protein A2796_06420 [Chlamydiae bacterium RIFCSPHIGHO2_01_FULL_44_39]OGN59398.1 MAG: hypothetical protein A3C42_05305 [Chlamydiae bacterium RIFCSPHIGHO2_02_FULL_45_9]OGN59630.1 MAG: hypothetical protein A3D96_06295 [Chlamydiae bacterium RIFCSPHIGHO2_12_FULL_44_59]OGN65720.1 MAG: hypothetical protein A2978_07290 [Chlamydiae bacterium RIFCSPLOWO2_01_FULL_44_52]OGN67862.1 MAG: hypothetical protein A3I67_05770 [Chlamydiae bacterium RIFCSPLOWO2_02_FULL_45_22]OGN69353.1 MAG: hyp